MNKKYGWVSVLLVVCSCFVLGVFGYSASAIDAYNTELVGRTGGRYDSVAVSGNYAYVAEGGGLSILNISNPGHPYAVGMLALPDEPQGVAVSGSYVYIADSYSGLRIVNVSNPANPYEVGHSDAFDYVNAVVVHGNYAYVADYDWVRVINISTASNPTDTGSYETPQGINTLTVSGNYVYVAESNVLRIVDISNPASPSEAGSYDTPGSEALGVAVSGNYAYVADWGSGLRIINISNPTNPSEVGYYQTPRYATGVAVSGNYAYVADGDDGLRIINVNDPANPEESGYYVTPDVAIAVAVSGSYAYVAAQDAGVQIINVSNPISPTLAGYYDTPGSAYAVTVSGNYAYVADYGLNYGSRFRIINIGNPTLPSEVGYCDTPGTGMGVAVSGNDAYIADWDYGLRIIDISNLTNPTEVGSYATPGNAEGVAVNGNYVYVADGWSGLRIINISTASNPTETGSCDLPAEAQGIAVNGSFAYVADGGSGLRVINISNPSSPVEVGSYIPPGSAAIGVTVSGNYAYVADYDAGLRIIDISTASIPHEVGYCDTPGYAYSVALNGNYAYVADYDQGLRIINIKNPTNPTEVAHYDTLSYSEGVAANGSYGFIADYTSGLWIFKLIPIPDVKLLRGKSLSNVFRLNNYLVNTTHGNWTWSSQTTFANVTIKTDSWTDYLTPLSSSAGQDTVAYTAPVVGYADSIVKYSTYLLNRLPEAVVDNGRKVLNCDINLSSYVTKDTSLSYPTVYPYTVRYSNGSDSGKLGITFSGSTLHISPSSALSGSAEVIVTATPGGANDWDKQIIGVSEVLDTYGEFSVASDTSHFWFQLPVMGAPELPAISWMSNFNGHSGVLALSFTTAAQGAKIVYDQELDIQPFTWYTLRCVFASGAGAGNHHQMSGQLFGVDTITGGSKTSQFLRQPGLIQDTTWWTQYAYIYSSSNSMVKLRPMLVVKNNSSSGTVYIDSMSVYANKPMTEQTFSALAKVSLPNGGFNLGTNGWFYDYPAMGVDTSEPLPGYSVVSSFNGQINVLKLTFSQVMQGIKLTSDPIVNITPLKSTKLSWKVYSSVSNNNRSVSGRVYCIDTASGGALSDVLGPSGINSGMASGEWITYTAVGTPLLNSETQVRVQLVIKNSNVANDTVYVDDFILEQENDSPNYWDHTLY